MKQQDEARGDDAGASLLGAAVQKVLHSTKMFKLKCAEDTYNDETRIKYTMQSCDPMNFAADSQVRPANP